MRFKLLLVFGLFASNGTASVAMDVADLPKIYRCSRELAAHEWYKVLDERMKTIGDETLFRVTVLISSGGHEEGFAILNSKDVVFYSTRNMTGKESKLVSGRWIFSGADYDYKGKPFHLYFLERPDEPGIHSQILPSEGKSEKDDPGSPYAYVKERILNEKELAGVLNQTVARLGDMLDKISEFKKINEGRGPSTFEACATIPKLAAKAKQATLDAAPKKK